MAEDDRPVATVVERPFYRRRGWQVLGAIVAVLLVGLAVLWSQRDEIANDVIGRELAKRHIPATYQIARIGGRRQVLKNLVVGADPNKPDLTVELARVYIRYRLGWPYVDRITLVKPRLYGTYYNGTLSFGTLDPLIFRKPTNRAFELPDLDLEIDDGRALLRTTYGPAGFKAQGKGNLRDGFRGILAIAAPHLAGFGCTGERASYYGTIAIDGRRPRLQGPFRLGRAACPERGLALSGAAIQADVKLDEAITTGEGTAKLALASLALAAGRAEAIRADTRVAYRNGALTLRLDGRTGPVVSPALALGELATEGTFRSHDGFARFGYQGTVTGAGVRPGGGLDAALAGFVRMAEGTLLAPLAEQTRRALLRESAGSRFTADVDYRQTGRAYTLNLPQARLRGGGGAALLELSRLQVAGGEGGAPRLAGNFVTGGPGVPQLSGRMERSERGMPVLRLSMAEYRAGDATLALPRLVLAQAGDGSVGFVGAARASGPLPGNGHARNLELPLDGSLAANGRLALFRHCTAVGFDRLTLANLTLLRRNLTLCPQPGAPILAAGGPGTFGGAMRLAFGAPSLDLAGRFGPTPVRIVSGPVGYANPGLITVRNLGIALGPPGKVSSFGLARLDARAEREISGSFAGALMRLAATPLDVTEATGRFRYAGGRLNVADAAFRVSDRVKPARFEPLVANGATMTFVSNRIDGQALLREPRTGREIARAGVHHELNSGRGHADLIVDDLVFDERLQPATISRLTLGQVANVRGAVHGAGRIDWSPTGVTSSGTFSTEGLDLAAAFGPVKGLAGTVHFTDLLGMVTAPHQEVRIASLNPGIEVTEGVLRFSLLPGSVFRLERATWPFLGGALSLEPLDLRLGVSEERRYVLVIDGLDAAKFVERMELTNISASGKFDGRLPLVFAAASGTEQVGAAVGALVGIGTIQGARAAASTPGSGRIVGGVLVSRPPGGNVAYVGELTRRDLSAMANFAFQTLRSLDYKHMTLHLNGALEGEIVTNVRFDGVHQGAGAKHNFLTKAVAKLPIQFNVNVRAPFYQLITSAKALQDPAFTKDPRDLGLIDARGKPILRAPPVVNPPADVAPPKGNIQPSESETKR